MQHYVASRPMFIDVEVMNADIRLVVGDQNAQLNPTDVSHGLSQLYKEITGLFCFYQNLSKEVYETNLFLFQFLETVRKEAATIMAVFPSPNEVMSILVQVQR